MKKKNAKFDFCHTIPESKAPFVENSGPVLTLEQEKLLKEQHDSKKEWIIETYDTNTHEWAPSNLNGIENTEWVRKAKVHNKSEILRCPNTLEWCMDIVKKSREFHKDFNPMEYRLSKLDSSEIVPCSIFV